MAEYNIKKKDSGLAVRISKKGCKLTEGDIFIDGYTFHHRKEGVELRTYDGYNPVILRSENEYRDMKPPVMMAGMFTIKLPEEFVEELFKKLETSNTPEI